MTDYRLWVNKDRTILITFWADGLMEVAVRADSDAIWGPPVTMQEEKT
jgi:hypothetical protein